MKYFLFLLMGGGLAATAYFSTNILGLISGVLIIVIGLIGGSMELWPLIKSRLSNISLPSLPSIRKTKNPSTLINQDRQAIDHLIERAKEIENDKVVQALCMINEEFFKIHHKI